MAIYVYLLSIRDVDVGPLDPVDLKISMIDMIVVKGAIPAWLPLSPCLALSIIQGTEYGL